MVMIRATVNSLEDWLNQNNLFDSNYSRSLFSKLNQFLLSKYIFISSFFILWVSIISLLYIIYKINKYHIQFSIKILDENHLISLFIILFKTFH